MRALTGIAKGLRMKRVNRITSWVAALAVVTAACTVGVHARLAGAGKPAAVAPGSSSELPSPKAATTEANIARLTANVLERSQFAHHPLDTELAGKFLDGYLDSLDSTHCLFLQSDVAEFSRYRATLAQATRTSGDTSPARAILKRYLERLEQQTAFATQLLTTEAFDFTGHDVYSLNREHAERPRDLTEAQELWRQQLRAEYLQEKLADASAEKIVQTLTRRYTQRLATVKGLDDKEVLGIFLDALAHVYDPHSDYLGHEELESLSIQMNLALFGIGATLENNDGYCEVRALLPGGPAERSGMLKPGDRIVAVTEPGKAAVEIENMPLSRTVELIRGPKGTPVTLTILPEGALDRALAKTVSLVRDEIKLEDGQAKARILDIPRAGGQTLRLGVLEVPAFYADMDGGKASEQRSATKDVARLLAKLKAEKVRGIVLDLRRNGGGSLNEAISLTGLFLRSGPVVQTRDPNGAIHVGVDEDARVQYDGPLVVLTSRFSASASEILTGALQDYGRALIVGDSSTFGKGTVQSVLPLARVMDEAGLAHSYDPGALKVTIQKFYRPDGESTQLRGVTSDIVLPSTSDVSDVSESALKNPLPWDAVPAKSHERLNAVRPFLPEVQQASQARVTSSKAFSYLADEIARLHTNLATKSVSLNEAERRAEISQTKARQAEREQVSKALRAAAPTAYEITLKNVDAAGLPPAMKSSDDDAEHAESPPISRAAQSRKAELASVDDILLDETTRILADYIGLLGHAPPKLSAAH
ncbi:MAG: carboxy terminal-processing peptidase [Pseudomonadota bacterium]